MGTHSNLKRFVCLAVVLAVGFAGIAYEAQAGGLKGGSGLKSGATTMSTGIVSNPLKAGATSVLNVNPRIGPPPPPCKGNCGGPKR